MKTLPGHLTLTLLHYSVNILVNIFMTSDNRPLYNYIYMKIIDIPQFGQRTAINIKLASAGWESHQVIHKRDASNLQPAEFNAIIYSIHPELMKWYFSGKFLNWL